MTTQATRSDQLHPDRLFPPDHQVRELARRIYERVAGLPLVSVHGHVEAELLAADRPFADPAELFVVKDHYVTRVLHSIGIPLEELRPGADPRGVWRLFCENWAAFRGTSTRLWLEDELTSLFEVPLPLDGAGADASYDLISERLRDDAYRPRALFRRFGLELLSTTDAPGSSYAAHDALRDAGLNVVPTLRPDRLTDPMRPDWEEALDQAGVTSYPGLVAHLRDERARTVAQGAVATDHGHTWPDTEDLGDLEAGRLFDRIRLERAGPEDRRRLAAQLLTANAVLALEDGLVMQLHSGVQRDHDRASAARFGPDIGADFPLPVSFVGPLRPLLERCGNETGLRFVVFTVDEISYSRELAPMASYWPALYLGAPWWFLDAPDSMARHFSAVAESAGYAKLTGFVDDTRAFCSIPSRHDVARRTIARHLAISVAEHRLSLEEAGAVAEAYAYGQPRSVYRVPTSS
ncbi:MAG: glucuronate isomerase [Candidatus Dormibacteraeota bacterium]|nr:glucuronate isomerase [Candidatus Dormibacteraeota bacterium]